MHPVAVLALSIAIGVIANRWRRRSGLQWWAFTILVQIVILILTADFNSDQLNQATTGYTIATTIQVVLTIGALAILPKLTPKSSTVTLGDQ